jgi:hypothetical protein
VFLSVLRKYCGTLNQGMTASFPILSDSLFTIIPSFDAIQFELLTASLNKLQINKQPVRCDGVHCDLYTKC